MTTQAKVSVSGRELREDGQKMVRLYTWGVATAATVLDNGTAPDVGHAALEVVSDEDHSPTLYASFWPERDSLIGKLTGLFRPRPTRNPESYVQETDADGAYMKRPADHIDTFEGLDEAQIARLWQSLSASQYDFLQWNCASVCKLLLLSAIPERARHALREVGYDTEDLANLSAGGDLEAELTRLSVSPFIDSYPEELRRIAESYLAAVSGP